VPIQSVTTRVKKQDETGTEENGVTNKKNERPKEDHPAPIVFVKVGDSVVTRTVKTGIRDDQYIEITDGLKPGDVVVSGSYKAISTDLENGSKVTISKPSSKKSSDTKGS
jgi:HlyD family secretion protein